MSEPKFNVGDRVRLKTNGGKHEGVVRSVDITYNIDAPHIHGNWSEELLEPAPERCACGEFEFAEEQHAHGGYWADSAGGMHNEHTRKRCWKHQEITK